jgi:hypothetical protein
MQEHGWDIIWVNWDSFFGMVMDPKHPKHNEMLNANVIVCEIDFIHDYE